MTPPLVGSCVTPTSFQLWRAPSLIAACSAALTDVKRSVLRVVALGLRPVGSIPLSLSHVLPPSYGCPSGKLFHTDMMPPTAARRTYQRPSRLLPSCYYNVTVLYHGGEK